MTGFNGGTQPIIFTHCEVRKNKKMQPHLSAQGDHSTRKENGAGQITGTQEWLQNPRNPNGFDSGARGDFNPAGPDHDGISTPHIHLPDGSVEPAQPANTPQNAATNTNKP